MSILINPYVLGVGAPVPTGFYAVVYHSADQTASPAGDLAFDTELSDVEGVHDISTNNGRFTVPLTWSGRYGMLTANMGLSTPAPGTMKFYKDGSSFSGTGFNTQTDTSGNDFGWMCSAPVLLTSGEYFTIHGDNTGNYLNNHHSWFQIEIMPSDYDGCLVKRSSAQTLAAATTETVLWNTEVYDIGGWHDNVTNPERLTVPSGTTLAQAAFGIATAASHSGQIVMNMRLNGAQARGLPVMDKDTSGVDAGHILSAPIAVTAGDYFDSRLYLVSGGDISTDDSTWASAWSLPSDLKYCIVNRTTNFSIPSGSTPTTIDWDAESVDTDAFHDNATNPSRLTVPVGSGLTHVRVMASLQNTSVAGQWGCRIIKNGSTVVGGGQMDTDTTGTDSAYACSAILAVSEGDYFEIQAYATSATSVTNTTLCWASIMEVRNPI